MSCQTHEPLSAIAGRLANLFEAVARAGGNPFGQDTKPPRVVLKPVQRRQLVAATASVLHGLRGAAREQALADAVCLFAHKITRLEAAECKRT